MPTGTHSLSAELPPGLAAQIPPIQLEFRGAAIGIAARPGSGQTNVYLPLLVQPGPAVPEPRPNQGGAFQLNRSKARGEIP